MKRLLIALLLLALPAAASRDASGNYVLPQPSVATGQIVTATLWNSNFNDLATEMQDSLSRSGKGGMLTAFKFADGTAAAPGLTFTNEISSGWYRFGASDIRLSLLGNDTLRVTPTGLFLSIAGGTPALYKIPNFYEMAMFFPNKMVNNQTLARIAFTNTTVLKLGLPNAITYVGTVAAASTTVTLNKRTAGGVVTSIGTLVWAASGRAATVSFTADVTFSPGDFIEILGPATADTALADTTITLQALRQ
jgi:hypothetical protein